MKKKPASVAIPILPVSPFASLEVVDADDLSPTDHAFLTEQETVIETGRKSFLAVGRALLQIRDYEKGRLYKRYGTFEDYCRERWELGRAHAYRLIDAVEIYAEMSPRGDNGQNAELPTTEKQLRELARLPTPKLKLRAWSETVAAAGQNHIRTSDVAKAVSAVIKSEGLAPSASQPKTQAKPAVYRISATDLASIRRKAKLLRSHLVKLRSGPKLTEILDEVIGLLPWAGAK